MPEQMEDIELVAGLSPEIKCKEGYKCFICQMDLSGQIGRRIIVAPLEENDNEAQILMCPACSEAFSFMAINHIYAVLKIMPVLFEESEEEPEDEGPDNEGGDSTDEDDNIIQMPGAEETEDETEQQ